MNKIRGFLAGWLSAVCVALLVAGVPSVALAKCSAFPVLSAIVDRVERLRAIETWEGVAAASLEINALTQNFNRAQLEAQLRDLALEHKLPMLIAFKDQTATLAQIASYDGPETLHGFMDSADYRPLFVEARETLTMACDLNSEGADSEFATRVITIEDEFALADFLRSLAPPVSITQVISIGMGVFSLALFVIWARNRRKMRDRRVSKRYACEIPARLSVTGKTIEVTIVDISQAGANVHCSEELAIDTEVEVEFADIHRTAVVKWSNEQFAGILMNRLIGESKLKKLIEQPAFEEEKRKAS
ncbi:MAG: PilZ domain-containing protein [Pseudomonadota bacterium]